MFFRMVYKSGQIFLPFCHNARVWRTDRQTDGQTDRILITRPRLHCMQRGKKRWWCLGYTVDMLNAVDLLILLGSDDCQFW